jgi:hypothetical protein
MGVRQTRWTVKIEVKKMIRRSEIGPVIPTTACGSVRNLAHLGAKPPGLTSF